MEQDTAVVSPRSPLPDSYQAILPVVDIPKAGNVFPGSDFSLLLTTSAPARDAITFNSLGEQNCIGIGIGGALRRALVSLSGTVLETRTGVAYLLN